VREENGDRRQHAILNRLEAMGLKARFMGGGRCVLASMPVSEEPFETLDEPLHFDEVVFSTVGQDRAKFLWPRLFFQLPLLRIAGCADAAAIEARLRLAWNQYLGELRASQQWLSGIGADALSSEGGSLLSTSVAGEGRPARAYVRSPRQVILPGRGALSGIALQRLEDRIHQIEPGIHSSADLDISISNRIDELLRLDKRRAAQRRQTALRDVEGALDRSAQRRSHRLLLVGPQISKDRRCIDSLKLRGYEVEAAATQQEALGLFAHSSPELVIADMNLGRSEGIDLIPAVRDVAGIEELPVILVDSHKRPSRREAAQRAGATGYLAHPVDVSSIAARLEKMVSEPRRRRYTRYPQKLAARLSGTENRCTATMLSRCGMFIHTRDELPSRNLYELRLSLYEIGETIDVEAEALYQLNTAGHDHRGVGLRFHSFRSASEESLLIDYLQGLEQSNAHC